MDWVPGLSQIKSLAQVTLGDAEGARRTQANFIRQCPVVSQVTSAIQVVAGDTDGAEETQKEFLKVVSGTVDSLPGVGHVKGGMHYACGDKDGGDRAMKASSRTTAVIGGGVGGFIVGGPVGLGKGAGVGVDRKASDSQNRGAR
ncbi:unnamed protein product [Meganyctiphanes norvegica]|uniref:Uncharacterized protein n=1 Tax=Meganyctiphanes norvegica TaxID=48144 RepID=A0AAV2Q583_MEGNR